MKRKRLYTAFVLVSFLLVATGPGLSQEPPPPEELELLPEGLRMPGTVEGTGTYFEVTDSQCLNLTLASSEMVSVRLESIPQMVVVHLQATEGAASSWITLGGFPASTTFYKYEDDYQNRAAFATDVNGSYAYAQGLSSPTWSSSSRNRERS